MAKTYKIFTLKFNKIKITFLIIFTTFFFLKTTNLKKHKTICEIKGVKITEKFASLGRHIKKFAIKLFLGFDVNNLESIIFCECPIFSLVNESILIKLSSEQHEIYEDLCN